MVPMHVQDLFGVVFEKRVKGTIVQTSEKDVVDVIDVSGEKRINCLLKCLEFILLSLNFK